MEQEHLLALLKGAPVYRRTALLRKMRDLTQGQLADLIKVNRSSISNWEAGPNAERGHLPDEESRDRLAFVFGVPAYVFTADFGPQNDRQAPASEGMRGMEKAREVQDGDWVPGFGRYSDPGKPKEEPTPAQPTPPEGVKRI